MGPEEFRARSGVVRCPHCFAPFSAFDHTVADHPPEPRPASVPRPVPPAVSPPSPGPAHVPHHKTGANPIDTIDRLVEHLDSRSLESAVRLGERSPTMPTHSAPPIAAQPPAPFREPLPQADALERVASGFAPTTARRWPWNLAIGLLTASLAAQATLLFRDELAAASPPFRSLQLEWCARLGCEVSRPQVLGAIRITHSALESDPDAPTRFVLHARLRNDAKIPQDHPHLELTLIDYGDHPVVRRVLGPSEWLGPGRAGGGFLPGDEVTVRIAFETTDDTRAIGYRLAAFFP